MQRGETGLGRWIGKGTALSVLVALPALFARPWADERTYIFWPEQIAGRNPLLLVARVVREVPGYLELGVFRWLSRLLTFVENWVLVRASLAIGLPVNILRALPKVAMIAVMATVLLVTLRQYQRADPAPSATTWRLLLATSSLSFGASLTIFSPPVHPLTLFPTLYLGSAAVALSIPLLLGRMRSNKAELEVAPSGLGGLRMVGFVMLGVALASMIELAYLAIPLGVLHLLLLERLSAPTWRAAWGRSRRSRPMRAWLALTAGFLATFIPVRLIIARLCSDGGCYPAAEPALGSVLWLRWPARMIAGAFPVLQIERINVGVGALRGTREVWILALIAAGLAVWIIRPTGTSGPEPSSSNRWMGAAAAYWMAVVILASLLFSLSRAVQERDLTLAPWRESGFAWVAWSALIAIGITLVVRHTGTAFRALAVLFLAGGVFLASVENQADLARVRRQPESRVLNQMALLLVEFDQTDPGNDQRCAVVDELIASANSAAAEEDARFLAGLLDSAADNHYRSDFCSR